MRSAMSESRRMARLLGSVSLSLLLGVACAPAVDEAPQSGATVFQGARLIIGDGSAPIENGAVVVQDDRITAVGPMAQVQVPAGAATVDLAGKTVIPAIIDAHKHVSRTEAELVPQLEEFAYFGVGAVMSMGQDEGPLAYQIRENPIPGAALLRTAGRGITRPEPGRNEIPYWIDTEEEARAAVQELADLRVDMVKMWVDDRDGQYPKLTPELYGAIIDEAHSHGLRTSAHVFTLEDAKGLVEAGLDIFAHGVRDMDVDDEFVQLVRDRPNVILIPNMPDRGVAVDMTWLDGSLPASEVDDLEARATDRPDAQAFWGIQARNLDRLSEAGMPIALGTDGGVPWEAHVQMVDMVAAGMTPAEVIVAATSSAARAVAIDDIGTLAPGMTADFIVLDANPLDDITNTRAISSVYIRGQQVDRAGLMTRMSAEATVE